MAGVLFWGFLSFFQNSFQFLDEHLEKPGFFNTPRVRDCKGGGWTAPPGRDVYASDPAASPNAVRTEAKRSPEKPDPERQSREG